MLSSMPPQNLTIALAGEHREYQDGAPKPYKPEQEPVFRASLLKLAQEGRVLHLTTLAPDGWPVTHCTPYATRADAGDRPIFYVLAKARSRKAFDVLHNPRVSLTIYHAISFERRRETAAVQIQALAHVVKDPEERRAAREALLAKEGTRIGNVEADAPDIIRIDSLSAVNYVASARPQWGTIDYLAPAGH